MISVKVEGEAVLNSALNYLADPAKRKDLLEQIGALGVSQTQQRFIDQAGPDGQAWVQSRRAIDESGQTLQKSNRLFQSLTYAADKDGVEWGTNVLYASIHQFGGDIKPKTKKALMFKIGGRMVMVKKVTMPARPYLGISDKNRAEIRDTVNEWMSGAVQ